MHAPLFTAPVLLVEQPHRLYASEGHYEVLDEQGHTLAFVNEHMMPRRGHGSRRPHRFTIYDPHGHPLLNLDKPWDRGRPHIHISGSHGEPYGTIVQDRRFMGSCFRIDDPRGHHVAEIRGDWNRWDFSITDSAGFEVARISKEHPGLDGNFFTTEDRYALEFAYDLPWHLRYLVLGAAITIDVLLHEREPEFYHSHYADFRRYPEYGYRPRHHWHHPHRGYIVAHRRRPPLVPLTRSRPVRRTTRHVPLSERVVSTRAPYRRFSTRARAPITGTRSAPAPRRTTQPPRRGGASRTNRSRRALGPASRQESAAASGKIARRARSERQRSGGGRTSSRSSAGGPVPRTPGSSFRASGSPSRRSGGGGSARGGSARKSLGSVARSAGKKFGASRSSGASSRRSSGRSSSRGGSPGKSFGSSRRSSGSARRSSGGSSRRSSGRRGGSSRRSAGRNRR